MATAFEVDLQKVTANIDRQGVQRYTREYLVEAYDDVTEDPVIDASEVDVGAALPFVWGEVHPEDANARVRSVTVTQAEDLMYWNATIEWDTSQDVTDRQTRDASDPFSTPSSLSSPPADPGGNSNQAAPAGRPWVVKYSGRNRTVYLQRDRLSADVKTTAGQFFDPGLPVEETNPVIHITAYRAIGGGFNPDSKVEAFQNKVNDAPFMGWADGLVKCIAYQASSEYENQAFFWKIEMEFEVKLDGWNPVVLLNAGTMVKKSNTSDELIPIVTNGGPVTSPVPLAADGVRTAVQASEAPNYLEFTGYATADFSQLLV